MAMFMEYNRRRQRRVLPYYLCAGLTMAMAREKTIWSVERSSVWWEDVVLETYNDQQWLENFRMGRRTSFEPLFSLSELSSSASSSTPLWSQALLITLIIALWPFPFLAHRFNYLHWRCSRPCTKYCIKFIIKLAHVTSSSTRSKAGLCKAKISA